MLKNILVGATLAALGLTSVASADDSHALDYVAHGPGAPAQYHGGEAYGGGYGTPAVTPWSTYEHPVPTLDYNYYYPAPGGYTTSARLYQSPRPTPLHVGYTYITYQPFAPHEYLWGHRAAYYSCYKGGVTVTRVKWGVGFHNHLHHALHHCH